MYAKCSSEDAARDRAAKLVRKAEKSLAVRVDVSSSAKGSTIAEKCTAEVLKAFTAVADKSLKPAMFVMEITALNDSPVEDMGKFSPKVHEVVAMLQKRGMPRPCCTRINHRQCDVTAIEITASWLEVDPSSTFTDTDWWKLYRS